MFQHVTLGSIFWASLAVLVRREEDVVVCYVVHFLSAHAQRVLDSRHARI